METYVIGRPQFDFDAFASFLSNQGTSWQRCEHAKPAEELVEIAGRMCYLSFGESQKERDNCRFITKLIDKGHESVLEHVNWTFLITGVSRALTHQLVRHRAGFSFSQLSQQYHDETDAEFVEPAQLRMHPHLHEIWSQAVSTTKDAYHQIIRVLEDEGKSSMNDTDEREFRHTVRSAARSVLPNATATKIVVTANARALRHFLAVRGSVSNDWEMRALAVSLLVHLQHEAPALFFDFCVSSLDDVSPIVVQTESP
jgi:thymidylate synthase (FAD)